MDPFSVVFTAIRDLSFFALAYWWIYSPIVLALGVFVVWRNYVETRYYLSLKWVLLEIKPPPEVMQSPKIAENFFSGLHAVYSKPLKEKKRFVEGKLQDWYSFEIVSHQGDMRFYIRTLESHRNLVESQIFAQYPDAEIQLVDDYTEQLPQKLPNDEYDVWGAELEFTKNNGYPIKTYPLFEDEGGKDEYRYIDPLAPLAELMTSLGPGEHLWMQYVARPTGDGWVKEAEPEINKIVGRPEKPKEKGFFWTIFDAIFGLIPGIEVPQTPEKKDEKEFSIQKLTGGQKFTLDQIENKIAKLAYKVTPRVMYIAKKDVFNRSRTTGLIGMFKQLYSNNLNTFKPNSKTATYTADGYLNWLFPSDKGFFWQQLEFERKVRMLKYYRGRDFEKVVILSTEEMATIFHLPGLNVKAPFFPRVESKKGQPPTGLPIK